MGTSLRPFACINPPLVLRSSTRCVLQDGTRPSLFLLFIALSYCPAPVTGRQRRQRRRTLRFISVSCCWRRSIRWMWGLCLQPGVLKEASVACNDRWLTVAADKRNKTRLHKPAVFTAFTPANSALTPVIMTQKNRLALGKWGGRNRLFQVRLLLSVENQKKKQLCA